MDPATIIDKYYPPGNPARDLLINHSACVAEMALDLARRLPDGAPDLDFIHEAAMLHDIGIFLVNAPGLGCHGKAHYVHHGHLGREILEKEGLPFHALVCDRHVGAGITRGEAVQSGLGLPKRDMVPESLEEILICYADKFHSKNGHAAGVVKSVDDIVRGLEAAAPGKGAVFTQWVDRFGIPAAPTLRPAA